MSTDLLTACFDRFRSTALRLETRPTYHDGDPGDGPRPIRSVRTNRYLARIARTTLVDGKTWRRLRVVDDPPTRYQLDQFDAYRESQAVGEIIDIMPRAMLRSGLDDMWLFDVDAHGACVVVLGWDEDGAPDPGRDELISEPTAVARLAGLVDTLMPCTSSLNEYLYRLADTGG